MTITKTGSTSGSTSGRETLQIRGALYWRSDNDDNDNNDGNNDNDTDNEYKSPSYESVRQQTYSVSAWSRPAARPVVIAVVKDASDVQACLQWAQQQQPQYTVCVRSGGHNWFESSLQQDTLLLDLSQLKGCQIDATTATATVEPACLGQALNEAAAAHGLCFLNGHCPGVPVGGFLLGGGFGWFADFYGLSVQSVIGVTVVAAAGEVVHATDEMHAANDWMWLCRGSGSAFPESYINDYPAMAEYIRAGRLSGEISPKVEASLVLASTPPGLVETVGVPKVCIVGFSCIADSTRECNSFVKTMEQIPSSPLLPYEPAANFAFGSLCEPLKAIYPAGWYWVTTGHILSHTSSNMDWWGIRDAFLQTPPGLTNTLTVIGCCINDNNTNDETIRDGAYGPVPFAGVIVGTFSVYQDEVDRPALLRYQAATNACTEPHVQMYNVLEHALNAETFIKVFPGATGVKLRALRTKLDPSGVFFDPTRARPW